jgi:hypothetical protein
MLSLQSIWRGSYLNPSATLALRARSFGPQGPPDDTSQTKWTRTHGAFLVLGGDKLLGYAVP